MAVVIQAVDLTPRQLYAIEKLTPITDRLIEQIKDYGSNRVTTKTFVRTGTGKNKREWLVRRNGRVVPNPTPGRGTPRG